MDGPSQHLSWNELKCKDGTEYPEQLRTNRAVRLAEVFELIRTICGNKPISVTSAYRTKEYNTSIGGARNSQHMEGKALDLKPPAGMTIKEFHNKIKKLAQAGTHIKGIGLYPTFVHVDTRNSEKIAYWSGQVIKDDRT